MFGSKKTANNDHPEVAYRNVRLVDDRSVDLYIHHSRGKGIWSYHSWLEEGRPRELSSLNLATWSLLTTSIKEYQFGLRQAASRVYARIVVPMYFIWLFVVFAAASNGIDSLWPTFAFFFVVLFSVMTASHYQQKHVDDVFNPAVQSVLEELQPKLTEAGWEVTLMTETGAWCGKSTKCFLRFTPLPDEEKAVTQNE